MYVKDAYGNKVKFQNDWIENRKKLSKRRTVSTLLRYDTKYLVEIELEKEGRFSNGEPLHYSKNGIRFFEINFRPDYEIPFNKYGTLLTVHGLQFKLCNPNADRQTIIDFLYSIFHEFVVIPYGLAKRFGGDSIKEAHRSIMYKVDEVIESIANKIIQIPYKDIQYKNNTTAYHFYNPNYELTTQEKNQLRLELQGRLRSSGKKEHIYQAMKEMLFLQMPLTRKGLQRHSGVALGTIKKYFNELRSRMFHEFFTSYLKSLEDIKTHVISNNYLLNFINRKAEPQNPEFNRLYMELKRS